MIYMVAPLLFTQIAWVSPSHSQASFFAAAT